MRNRLWGVVVCAVLLVAGAPGAASADTGRPATGPATEKPAEPAAEKPITTVRQISPGSADLPSPRRSADGAEQSATGQPAARQRILERDARRARGEPAPEGPRVAEAPLLSPDLNVGDCQQEPFAYAEGGFVIDH